MQNVSAFSYDQLRTAEAPVDRKKINQHYSLPLGPRLRCARAHIRVDRIQLRMVREDHIPAFLFWNGREELIPGLWEKVRSAVLVEEVQLRFAEGEDATVGEVVNVAFYEASRGLGKGEGSNKNVAHRRTSVLTRSGCVCAYASESVEPHEPPKTCHLSILSSSRSFSMSFTRSHVVFSSSDACGVDFPEPRWSRRMICVA